MIEGLKERLKTVNDRVAEAARRGGRKADEIKLIPVSKTHPVPVLREAMAAGVSCFGENKVQEAQAKQAATRDLKIAWHLIGHLQSNKAKKAAMEFDWIHSIDAPDLVRKIDAAAGAEGVDEALGEAAAVAEATGAVSSLATIEEEREALGASAR